MNPKSILIVEDEPSISSGINDYLTASGYQVYIASNGHEALDIINKNHIDLIVLDLMLPDISGYEICEKIRNMNILTPIIMLTARSQENDKIKGLEIGADDYLTKPFSIRELTARIQAQIRRMETLPPPMEEVTINKIHVNFTKMEVIKDNKNLDLTPMEYKMLKYFLSNPDRTIPREELIERVWEYESMITTRTIDNHILKIRKIFEINPKKPQLFETVHGVGYKLNWGKQA